PARTRAYCCHLAVPGRVRGGVGTDPVHGCPHVLRLRGEAIPAQVDGDGPAGQSVVEVKDDEPGLRQLESDVVVVRPAAADPSPAVDEEQGWGGVLHGGELWVVLVEVQFMLLPIVPDERRIRDVLV